MRPSKEHIKQMHVKEIFKYPSSLFWDVNMDELNPFFDHEFIIIRALSRLYADKHQLFELDKIYPKPVILDVLNKRQNEILGIELFQDIGDHYGLVLSNYKKYNSLVSSINHGSIA